MNWLEVDKWAVVWWGQFQFVWGNNGPYILWTIPIVFNAKVKSPHLWWYGGVSVHLASWVIVTSGKAPFRPRGTNRFWSNLRFHPADIVVRDITAYFSKTMKQHCWNTATWLHSKRAKVQNRPVSEMAPDVMGHKIWQWKLLSNISRRIPLWKLRCPFCLGPIRFMCSLSGSLSVCCYIV